MDKEYPNPEEYTQRLQSYIANNRITIEVLRFFQPPDQSALASSTTLSFGEMLNAELGATHLWPNHLILEHHSVTKNRLGCRCIRYEQNKYETP